MARKRSAPTARPRRPLGAALAMLALAAALAPAPLAAINVIQDSDMEQAGLANWPHGDIAGTNSSAKATDHVQSPVQSLKGTSAAGNRLDVDWFNSQSVGVIDNPPSVTLSLWWGIQYNVNSNSGRGDLLFEINDGGGWRTIWTTTPVASTSFQSGTVTNFDVTAEFAGATASYDVRVRFSGRTGRDNAATVNVWWDDVVLDVGGAAATTTVGNGTDPGAANRCPGDGAADLDAFTLQTDSGTDTVTAVQVSFAAGTAVGLGLVEITSNNGATVYGSAANPTDVQSIPLTTNIPVNTTLTQYRVRVTPKSDAAMPAPPGAIYVVTGTVTDITASNTKNLQDTGSGTVTIDNQSPGGATFNSCTGIDSGRIDVTWNNPAGDFSGVLVVRGPAGGACPTFAPIEGTSYGTGPQGADTIIHAGAGVSASDTGLAANTSYCYEVWSFDACLNYFQGPPDTTTCSTPPAGNTAPVVTITAPPDASTFTQGDTIIFTGTATDAEDGDLTAGLAWTSSIDGAIGSGGSFSRNDLSIGTHTITASVTDSGSLQGQDQITITVNPPGNDPPVVTITSPTSGSSFNQGDPITFTGTATDTEDGDLTASLAWTSSIDGAIGSGGSFVRSDLTPGSHTITASVTDSGGASGQDQITLTVLSPGNNDTILGPAEAAPSSCQQITASSTFTGDDNDNGSTLFESSPAGAGSWTTACATVTGASPRLCLVVGLTGGQSYDIRITHTDPDNSPPLGSQTVSNVALPACGADTAAPTVLVLTPRRNAVLGSVDKVKVQVFDAGGLAAVDPVQWSVDGGTLSNAVTVNSNYNCNIGAATGCAIYEFDLDTTGLANGGHRLTIEATDAAGNVARLGWGFRSNNTVGGQSRGGGLLLRRSHGSQICVDCHNLPTHSSQATSTQYGNWALECLTCHTPHGTSNIFLIREDLRTPNSGRKTVNFHRDDRVGETNPGDVPGNFGFLGERDPLNANLPYNDGVCEACHTRTDHWRNDTVSGGDHLHNANTRCLKCHTHQSGFRGAGACLDCHGNAGDAGTQGPNSRRPVNPDFEKTSHHVGTAAGQALTGALTSFDCVVCHGEGRIEGGEVRTVPLFHGGDGGPTTIDLKNADTWNDAAPDASMVFSYDKAAVAASAGAAANWGSSNAVWRSETSTHLDPFCLGCHDSDGALNSFNATDGGSALNPFGDDAITNDYDQRFRNPASPTVGPGRVVDIKSKVTADADRDADGIADAPQGIYSRHAIRGQAASVYVQYNPASVPAVCGNNSNAPCDTMWGGDADSGGAPLFVQTGASDAQGPLWNDTSVMGCADCHTTDGANGTAGNAHGSSSEYLLKDAAGGATLGHFAGFTYVCFRCHSSGRYQDNRNAPLGAHRDTSNDWVDTAGVVGPANRLAGDGNIYGIACMNCHGAAPGSGNNGFTGAPDPFGFGFGQIHGTSSVYRVEDGTAPFGATRPGYRFMNGASNRFYNPVAWQDADVACFTLSGAGDEYGGCTQHTGARGFTKPHVRALRY